MSAFSVPDQRIKEKTDAEEVIRRAWTPQLTLFRNKNRGRDAGASNVAWEETYFLKRVSHVERFGSFIHDIKGQLSFICRRSIEECLIN